MTPYCLIYITTKDEAETRITGKALVGERLAACVNIEYSEERLGDAFRFR